MADTIDPKMVKWDDAPAPQIDPRMVKWDDTPKQDYGRLPGVALGGANRAIAGTIDSVLNAPTNVWNLLKAGYGTVQGALGNANQMPALTPNPDLVSRLFDATKVTSPASLPQTPLEKYTAAASGGATGMAMNPATSGMGLAANLGLGAASGVVGSGVTQATGDPNLGTSAAILTPLAAQTAANYATNAREQANQARGANAVRDQTLADAREAGYTVPPSSVNTGSTVKNFINNRLTGIAGKAATNQASSANNQGVTNRLAAEDLGFPPGTAITEGALDRYRTQVSQPYREIAGIDPEADATLQELRQARNDASRYFKSYDRSANPEHQDVAFATRDRANLLESQLEDMATNANRPDLVQQMRAARQAIAKSYDIERALNLGNADISARTVGNAFDRGAPLTGNLQTIGRFAQGFPAANAPSATNPAAGVSKMEALTSLGLGLSGHATMGPMGWLLAGLPLASGPIRSGILSQPYQRLMATPSYEPNAIARLLQGVPQQSPEQIGIRGILSGNMNGVLSQQ